MPKGQTKTIVETEAFELYTDHLGRYWLWNKFEEVNHCIRANTLEEAWIVGMNSAIGYARMFKEGRTEAREKLEKIETVVKDVLELHDDGGYCDCY